MRFWDCRNVFMKLDSFGHEVPAFNIGGESTISTITGGILTSFLLIIGLSYAVVKAVHLSERKDVLISSNLETGALI